MVEGHQWFQRYKLHFCRRSLCLVFTFDFFLHLTSQSIKLLALTEFHYPRRHHTDTTSHRPLPSGGIAPSEQLCTPCARALSAALFVTGSWQSPIRACTRKQRGANERFAFLSYCYFCRIETLSPLHLKHVFLLLIVYILTFVSVSVHMYCSYWMLLLRICF